MDSQEINQQNNANQSALVKNLQQSQKKQQKCQVAIQNQGNINPSTTQVQNLETQTKNNQSQKQENVKQQTVEQQHQIKPEQICQEKSNTQPIQQQVQHQNINKQIQKIEQKAQLESTIQSHEPAIEQKPVKQDVKLTKTIEQPIQNLSKSISNNEEKVQTKQTPIWQKIQQRPITVKIFEQKLTQATQLKNSGNLFFKQKNYVQAIQKYSKSLQLLDPSHFYAATQDQCKKMAELSGTLLCNMGFCYFNSHDMVRADLYFSQAIAINPKYTKALHKRALARFELKKFEGAMEDIKLAFNLEKTNSQIHAAYSKILEKYNQQAKKNKQKMKELSSKIFNNDTQKSDIKTKKIENKIIKTQQRKQNKVQQQKQSGWSWTSIATFAGAAALIGAGIYKALSKH